jgi:hypothetical protein
MCAVTYVALAAPQRRCQPPGRLCRQKDRGRATNDRRSFGSPYAVRPQRVRNSIGGVPVGPRRRAVQSETTQAVVLQVRNALSLSDTSWPVDAVGRMARSGADDSRPEPQSASRIRVEAFQVVSLIHRTPPFAFADYQYRSEAANQVVRRLRETRISSPTRSKCANTRSASDDGATAGIATDPIRFDRGGGLAPVDGVATRGSCAMASASIARPTSASSAFSSAAFFASAVSFWAASTRAR